MSRVRIIGYGNPARMDDGLGPALAGRIAAMGLDGVATDIDFQLSVEHADLICGDAVVVFVDATVSEGAGPFDFAPVDEAVTAMGSHSVGPGAVLALSRLLFGRAPDGYTLGIRGETFGAVGEGLSATAQSNLDAAQRFLTDWLQARLIAA